MRAPVPVVSVTAALVLLSGCGAHPAGRDVNDALDGVDQAVAARHWRDARTRLDDLVRAAEQEQQQGTLSASRAQQIEAAAARLAVQIPRAGAPREAAGPATPATDATGSGGDEGD